MLFYKSSGPRLRAGSLVPETCHKLRTFANLVADPVRQAKADFPLVLRARIKAWLRYWRSLAWWQASSRRRLFDPVGEIPQPIVTGPSWIPIFRLGVRDDS